MYQNQTNAIKISTVTTAPFIWNKQRFLYIKCL